ncbi:MAG TPA: gliding motility protein GldM [Ferruginibacter sp.]|nr:gliding motility protein GldM [Ferruginibacter sp.]
MALPREPRQKMINIMYLVLTAILALNVSNEVINAFKVVDRSLIATNASLSATNNTIYKTLEEKLKENETREKATEWKPKADRAKGYSDLLFNHIENLKLQLKRGAGLKMKAPKPETGVPDSIQDFKEDNLDASTRLFETNGEGKKLEAMLNKYREDLLNIDPLIRAKFDKTLQFDTKPPVSLEGKQKDFTTTYFHMTPTVAALTMLSKFQNSVKNAENQVVTFCLSQIGAVIFQLNKFEPIAVSNSTYIMPGEKFTITAGVGAFNDAVKPIISIDGVVTVLNANGVAEREVIASGSGTKKSHVRITYTDPNTGKPAVLDKDIEYTVGTPGGAAVMLDKMNVFYIGVDNPVTIGSPTGWDKTTVSMSGGTISGSGSQRTVRVSAVGAATINVNADGKPSTYKFRVKRIPDPVFKVGTGKVRMPAVEFKNQQYCRAELENFDFDLKFSVVSATVYFSGANFPNVATTTITSNNLGSLDAYMRRCGPGSVITFDNVKVSGPDGTRSIDGKSIALY